MKMLLLPFVIIAIAVITMISCRKDPPTPIIEKPVDTSLPTKATILATMDTSNLFNGKVTVNINSDAQTTTCNGLNIGSVVTISGLVNDTTLYIIGTNTNKNGSTITNLVVTIKQPYASKNFALQNLGALRWISYRSLTKGQTTWVDIGALISPGYLAQFSANFTAFAKDGNHPSGGEFPWSWYDKTQTSFYFGPVDPIYLYNIEFVEPNQIRLTQIYDANGDIREITFAP